MHTVERFRRTSVGHKDLELTVDDPKCMCAIHGEVPGAPVADTETPESVCADNKGTVRAWINSLAKPASYNRSEGEFK